MSISISTSAHTGTSISEVLEYPKDSQSISLGYTVCGDILVSFLNEKEVEFDISTTGFLSYDESTKTLKVQSYSFADAGTYNFQVQYKLTNYPTVKSSIPLTIKIQTPPTLPITISPKPLSAYTVEPGAKLTLTFEISDPQNV